MCGLHLELLPPAAADLPTHISCTATEGRAAGASRPGGICVEAGDLVLLTCHLTDLSPGRGTPALAVGPSSCLSAVATVVKAAGDGVQVGNTEGGGCLAARACMLVHAPCIRWGSAA